MSPLSAADFAGFRARSNRRGAGAKRFCSKRGKSAGARRGATAANSSTATRRTICRASPAPPARRRGFCSMPRAPRSICCAPASTISKSNATSAGLFVRRRQSAASARIGARARFARARIRLSDSPFGPRANARRDRQRALCRRARRPRLRPFASAQYALGTRARGARKRSRDLRALTGARDRKNRDRVFDPNRRRRFALLATGAVRQRLYGRIAPAPAPPHYAGGDLYRRDRAAGRTRGRAHPGRARRLRREFRHRLFPRRRRAAFIRRARELHGARAARFGARYAGANVADFSAVGGCENRARLGRQCRHHAKPFSRYRARFRRRPLRARIFRTRRRAFGIRGQTAGRRDGGRGGIVRCFRARQASLVSGRARFAGAYFGGGRCCIFACAICCEKLRDRRRRRGAVALAAALAARRAGFDVARAGGAFDGRRAERFFALGAASVDFLREIDAWDATAATPVYRMRLCANDRVLDLRAARGRTLCAVIRESRLLESLQNRIGESENCEREIESITADSESIRIGLTGGTLTAKLLVAADGARSPVARLLGVAAAGKHYRQTALTALLRAQKPAVNTAAQFFGRRETLGFLPVDDETTALIWSLPTEQAAAARADRDFFAARARERSRGFSVISKFWARLARFRWRRLRALRVARRA